MLQVNRFIEFNKILQKILVIIVDLWYNKDVVFLGDIDIMFNKFDFDIENIKRDFQIENMQINASDVEMLRKYNNNEITMSDMISSIKKEYSK